MLFTRSAYSQNFVCLYEDCNFRGRSADINTGNFRAKEMKLSVYESENFGLKFIVTGNNFFQGFFILRTFCIQPFIPPGKIQPIIVFILFMMEGMMCSADHPAGEWGTGKPAGI